MSDLPKLNEIEQRARDYVSPVESCDMGDNGEPCDECLERRTLARDVLALVEIAKAAQRMSVYDCPRGVAVDNTKEYVADFKALIAALARLDATTTEQT